MPKMKSMVVHALAGRKGSEWVYEGFKKTFRKQRDLVLCGLERENANDFMVATDYTEVTCPLCKETELYKGVIVKRLLDRINQTAHPVAIQHGKTWKRTTWTGPE
jgi:predicted nucleic-acid-binding Zn-ribbon protein